MYLKCVIPSSTIFQNDSFFSCELLLPYLLTGATYMALIGVDGSLNVINGSHWECRDHSYMAHNENMWQQFGGRLMAECNVPDS